MKIIILGAGQVGATVAEHLLEEGNDITVVDTDPQRLHELQNRLDIRPIVGPASHPSVLKLAGAEDADMLIAVTSSDETNMIACQVAYSIYHTPTKLARIRSQEYLDHEELFDNLVLPIDVCISPEQLVTNHAKRIIENPGTIQVVDFAEGKVKLVGLHAHPKGPMVGKPLNEFAKLYPSTPACIAAIFRGHTIKNSHSRASHPDRTLIATPGY